MPQQPLLKKPEELTPIQKAYKPLPEGKETDISTRIMDFARGFFGTKPGLTDPNSRTATAAGDAFGQLNPMHMLGPVVGMTKFIKTLSTGERVPDIAARVNATRNSMADLGRYLLGSKTNSEDALKTFEIANKYPRTMAHVESIRPGKDKFHLGEQLQEGPKTSSIRLNKDLPNLNSEMMNPVSETFAHELQHVGQQIRDPNLPENYVKALGKYGYNDNPYEIAAQRGSAKRISPIQGKTFLERISPDDVKARYSMVPKPTLSEAFSKSPLALQNYYNKLKSSTKEVNNPINIRQQLEDSLKEQNKLKGIFSMKSNEDYGTTKGVFGQDMKNVESEADNIRRRLVNYEHFDVNTEYDNTQDRMAQAAKKGLLARLAQEMSKNTVK